MEVLQLLHPFSPADQGVNATFVLNSLIDPGTDGFARPSANGLFMGVVAGQSVTDAADVFF